MEMEEIPHGMSCTVESILNHCLTAKMSTSTTTRKQPAKAKGKNRKKKLMNPVIPATGKAPNSVVDVVDVTTSSSRREPADDDSGLEESVDQVRMRFSQGCECQDQSCFQNINPEFVYKHRLNIAELTRSEHDMYLMGVTMASLSNPEETARHTERKRLRTQYVFQVHAYTNLTPLSDIQQLTYSLSFTFSISESLSINHIRRFSCWIRFLFF